MYPISGKYPICIPFPAQNCFAYLLLKEIVEAAFISCEKNSFTSSILINFHNENDKFREPIHLSQKRQFPSFCFHPCICFHPKCKDENKLPLPVPPDFLAWMPGPNMSFQIPSRKNLFKKEVLKPDSSFCKPQNVLLAAIARIP